MVILGVVWVLRTEMMAFVLLNLAGGGCVDDLRILESDEWFCRIFRDVEDVGLSRKLKRAKRLQQKTSGIYLQFPQFLGP
jgi:hypothetical protein